MLTFGDDSVSGWWSLTRFAAGSSEFIPCASAFAPFLSAFSAFVTAESCGKIGCGGCASSNCSPSKGRLKACSGASGLETGSDMLLRFWRPVLSRAS